MGSSGPRRTQEASQAIKCTWICTRPMTFVNMNKHQKIQATDDPKLEKMIQTLTFDSQAKVGE